MTRITLVASSLLGAASILLALTGAALSSTPLFAREPLVNNCQQLCESAFHCNTCCFTECYTEGEPVCPCECKETFFDPTCPNFVTCACQPVP
jgi:hypothetical protein